MNRKKCMPLFYSQSIELLTSRARVRRSFRVSQRSERRERASKRPSLACASQQQQQWPSQARLDQDQADGPLFSSLRQIKDYSQSKNVTHVIGSCQFSVFLNHVRFSRGYHVSKPVESFFHCFYIIPFTGKNNVSNSNNSGKTLLNLPITIFLAQRT